MKNSPFAILSLFTALISVSVWGVEPGEHALTFTSDIDGTEQPFHLFMPDGDPEKERPLVIVLHGLGAHSGIWFERTNICEVASREDWVVAAPQGRGNWFYLGPGEIDVLEVLEETKRLCNIDESRVYLFGHSMGGHGTFQIGVSHPNLFAAIVPFAGWASLDQVTNLQYVPTTIVHGDNDVIVPVDRSRDAFAKMTDLGLPVEYIEMPGQGHGSNMLSDEMPRITQWIRGLERPTEFPEVHARTYTARRGTVGPIDFLETTDFPHLAKIDLTREGTDLNISTDNVSRFALREIIPANTKIVIDGSHFRIPTQRESLAFIKGPDRWTFTADDTEATTVIGHVAASIEHTLPVLCEILAEESGCDTALMRGVYACPEVLEGDLTEDEALDLYLRPMDDLLIADLPASVIEEITKSGRNGMGPVVDLTDPDRIYHVAMTRYQARRLPEGYEAESTGKRVSAIIVDHLEAGGSLNRP